MAEIIKGVVFDWAGTTVDFGCFAPVAAFREAFRKAGVEVTLEETRAPMGMLKIDHIRTMLAMPGVKARWESAHGRVPTDADAEAIYRDFEPALFSVLENHCEVKPGLLEALAALRAQNLRIGSTTGYTKKMMAVVERLAREAGYAPEVVATAEDVGGFGRPWPFMVFKNMRELELPAVRAVVKVGDTVSDIREGVAAGVWSVGVVDGSSVMGLTRVEFEALTPEAREAERSRVRRVFEEAGADAVINDLTELPALIGRLDEEAKKAK